MITKVLFARCLSQASKTFGLLGNNNYSLATPDTEWDAQALANHMVYELSWLPDILAGKTITEVGDRYEGDLLGDDPQLAWQRAGQHAIQCVEEVDLDRTVHLSYGDVTGDHYVRQLSGDLFIHSWDLAAALGADRELNPSTAQAVYDNYVSDKDSLGGSGLFKPPLHVPEDASIQAKLLALTGRDPDWQPK